MQRVPVPAAINLAHPEAAGLVSCLVARPGSMLDLVTQSYGTRSGTADPSRFARSGVLGAYFDGNADGYSWGSTLPVFPTGAFTLVWECHLDNLTIVSPQLMGWYRNDAGNGPTRLVYTTGGDDISLARGISEAVSFTRPAAVPFLDQHYGVWVFRGGVYTTTSNHSVFLNSIRLAAGTAGSFGLRTDRTEVGGSSSAGANDWAGHVRQVRLYDYAWPDALAMAWSARGDDGLFSRPARRVFALEFGGDAPADLLVSDAAHLHAADNLALTQAHVLVVQDGAHGHVVDALALTQAHLLALADALHEHAAENITLAAGLSIVVADGLHAHTADNLALTQVHILIVGDAAHGHAADAISLAGGASLSVADLTHLHAAESPVLSSAYLLVIADAVHQALSESPALTQAHQIIVSDALHAHFAAQVSFGNVLTTSDERILIVPAQGRILVVAKPERNLH